MPFTTVRVFTAVPFLCLIPHAERFIIVQNFAIMSCIVFEYIDYRSTATYSLVLLQPSCTAYSAKSRKQPAIRLRKEKIVCLPLPTMNACILYSTSVDCIYHQAPLLLVIHSLQHTPPIITAVQLANFAFLSHQQLIPYNSPSAASAPAPP